jgi:hypothetical protein
MGQMGKKRGIVTIKAEFNSRWLRFLCFVLGCMIAKSTQLRGTWIFQVWHVFDIRRILSRYRWFLRQPRTLSTPPNSPESTFM